MTLTDSQIRRLQIEDGLVSASGASEAAEQTEDQALRVALRASLMPGLVPSLAPEVMGSLGCEALPLGNVLRDAAGEVGAFWPGIAAEIGAPVGGVGDILREALLAAAEEEPPRHFNRVWLWGSIGLAAAAAAAMLLINVALEPDRVPDPIARAVEVVEPVVQALPDELNLPGLTMIEALESETASVVQVLQFDSEAPTIILIDEDTED